MTFQEAYEAASAWLLTSMQVTEWGLDTITEGTPLESPENDEGVYQLQSCTIENETPVTDEVTMTWVVMGKWLNTPALGREIFKATKAHFMYHILSDGAAGIYHPQVLEVDFTDLFDDDSITVTLTVSCKASVTR